MLESEKYKLSTYNSVKKLRSTADASVEIVESTLDNTRYIKKTYNSDKRHAYRILKEIDSVNIPKVYEVFFGEETIIIEEYIEGVTLEKLISEKHLFSKAEAEKIVSGLLSAIWAIHKKDLIHRDIKPSNIIIKPSGEAVLIDYGIARAYSPIRSNDTELFGTVGYAAPEQFGFSQSDYRTDIYALGITLRHILTSKNAGKNLLKAVEKCVEFDPLRRFQTIEELKSFLKNEGAKKKTVISLCIALGLTIAFALSFAALIHFGNESSPQDTTLSNGTTTEALPKDTHNFETESNTESSYDTPLESAPTSPDTTEAESDTQIPDTTYIESDTESPENEDVLLLYPSDTRIVKTKGSHILIPCLPLEDENTYTASINIGNGKPDLRIEAKRTAEKIHLTINGEATFSFTDNGSMPKLDYPQGKPLGEIIFYDMDNDGILEIIPILTNGVKTEWADGSTVLMKNYSLGWCIYYTENGFECAEGEMSALLEQFTIYSTMPGCINTDFPSYYKLEDGKIVIY